jgi:hypothetical protein
MAAAPQRASRVDTNSEALLEQTLAECEETAARLKDLLRLADALIAVLPAERKIFHSPAVARFRAVARSAPAAAFNDNVIAIVTEHQPLSTQDVCSLLINRGIPADQKQVSNSLDYLARRGQLHRIARGRYVIAGYGIGIEGDMGEEYR